VAATRTTIRRIPKRTVTDRAQMEAILDEGIVAHVGFVHDGAPFVMPTGYVRDGERLLLHGSTASRLMQALAAGADACITVTLLDALVLARSAFHHSMNYRSVVVFGRATPIEGDEAKMAALATYMERLVPGRWDEARRPNRKELAATMVVELPLVEWSCKQRAGPPADEPEDMAWPAWSGIVSLALHAGKPEQDPTQSPKKPAPGHVAQWQPNRRRA
jgi:nitroimidazol reductase NimA-like FMN-containing flavoprotein (pyridoxamine 5'-phosphate oxidase superfamily)